MRDFGWILHVVEYVYGRGNRCCTREFLPAEIIRKGHPGPILPRSRTKAQPVTKNAEKTIRGRKKILA